MDIEQLPPTKPNFLLILILFCASLLVLFLLAFLFLRFDGGHIHLRHHDKHPTSQLILPASPTTLA
jgi:hypothetical protein